MICNYINVLQPGGNSVVPALRVFFVVRIKRGREGEKRRGGRDELSFLPASSARNCAGLQLRSEVGPWGRH